MNYISIPIIPPDTEESIKNRLDKLGSLRRCDGSIVTWICNWGILYGDYGSFYVDQAPESRTAFHIAEFKYLATDRWGTRWEYCPSCKMSRDPKLEAMCNALKRIYP